MTSIVVDDLKRRPAHNKLLVHAKQSMNRVHQIWTDLKNMTTDTWVRMQKGFMYMFAIIDAYSLYILNWSVLNPMDAEWRIEVLNEAIEMHGTPEIFNTDQGKSIYLSTL